MAADWRVRRVRYEDIRALARKYEQRESFGHIWAYSRHIISNAPLYQYRHVDGWGNPLELRKFLHGFQLEQILREVVLHSPLGDKCPRSLERWEDLGELHNLLRTFADQCSSQGDMRDVMVILHRLSHQQMRWFDRLSTRHLARYWVLYNSLKLRSVVEAKIGMSILDYFCLGLLTTGATHSAHYVQADQTDVPSLDPVATRDFFRRISAPIHLLRKEAIRHQRFGAIWEYTFNPVRKWPLVSLDPKNPWLLCCPMPALLDWRLFQGLFFDIANEPGYPDAIGDAVEELAGKIISEACPAIALHKPKPYESRNGLRHGPDWILSGNDAAVVIECKATRITLSAQIAETSSDIRDGVQQLAKAIVQNYKNIQDILAGATGWLHHGSPLYSLVVTLEDWKLFSLETTRHLNELVADGLSAAKVDQAVVRKHPYFVVSISELISLAPTLTQHGIDVVLKKKNSPEYSQFLMSAFLDECYPEHAETDRRALNEEYTALLAKIQERIAPNGPSIWG